MIEEPKSLRIDGDELIVDSQSHTETYDARYLVAALLVFVAKGDGTITESETHEMLALIEDQYRMPSAESLALLTRAIADIADNPQLGELLGEISSNLSVPEKEHIALMMLKVVAADDSKDAEEMERLRAAAEMISIPEDAMHRAFHRYFEGFRGLEEDDETPSEHLWTSSKIHKSRLGGLVIACETDDLDAASGFWAQALGAPAKHAEDLSASPYVVLNMPAGGPYVEIQRVDRASRVHIEIETDDVRAEVSRLEKLGAKRIDAIREWVVLEAPTGQRFRVAPVVSADFSGLAHIWSSND